MRLADNVRNGEAAVEYVKGLGIKAPGKAGDRVEAAGGAENVIVAGGFDDTALQGVGRTRTAGVRAMTIGNLRGTAEYTERTGFGNRWEQAIIASACSRAIPSRRSGPIDGSRSDVDGVGRRAAATARRAVGGTGRVKRT